MIYGRRRTTVILLLLLPAFVLLALMVAGISTLVLQSVTAPDGGLSADRYIRATTTAYYLATFARSLKLAAITTLFCLLFGFPLAFYMELASSRVRRLIVQFLVMLFFTEYVMRVYALVLIIGKQGLINQTLLYVGLIGEPLQIMYTETGVCFGLITGNIVFMVFAINGVLARINPDFRNAALLLGANEWQVLLRVILPLSVPGIVAGSTIVFLLAMSAYLTPTLLGGGRVKMIANVIFDQAVSMFDVPMAAALAVVLLVLTLAIVVVVNLAVAPLNRRLGEAR